MDREHLGVDYLLAEAAYLVRREKEATENAEPAEGYKRGQIEKLKEFATLNDLWIDFNLTSIKVGKMKYSPVKASTTRIKAAYQPFHRINKSFRTRTKCIHQSKVTVSKVTVITCLTFLEQQTEGCPIIQTQTPGTHKVHGELCFHTIMRISLYFTMQQ